jgi:hypothetical protein
MSPDEREQIPPPADCHKCVHDTRYITQERVRHLCELGKPAHPGCPWFKLREGPPCKQ